jgi:uncharacterized protein (TIGR01777 family)
MKENKAMSPSGRPNTWLLAGGTGLIGRRLADALKSQGHEVKVLSRKGPDGWAPGEKSLAPEVFKGVDVVVNLAGASVGEGRWTPARKKELLDSRIHPISTLQEALSQTDTKPFFIQASAIGYYGFDASTAVLTEENGPGKDFLAQLCVDWEASAQTLIPVTSGLAILRIGVVLDARGGALPKMLAPVKWFAGAAPGSGKQGISWVHADDVVQAILFIAAHQQQGIFNVVAPEPLSMKQFMKEAAKQLQRPFWPFPIPGVLLKLAMGEQADLVIKGSLVKPSRLLEAGYIFRFPKLPDALKNLVTLQV